jgi:hypothetical protein
MGQSTEPPLEQVRAEVARLRLERDALRGQISHMQEITHAWELELDRLRAEVARLRQVPLQIDSGSLMAPAPDSWQALPSDRAS